MDALTDIAPFAWPLMVLLLLLVILRKIESTINPIVAGVVNGLANQASNNALTYGLMIGYGLSASLSSLADQATILHWPVIAAMAKVVGPFVTAMLAFAAKNSIGNIPPAKLPSSPTTAPFPPATQ